MYKAIKANQVGVLAENGFWGHYFLFVYETHSKQAH